MRWLTSFPAWCLLLSLMAGMAQAASREVPDLYAFEVGVADAGDAARKAALREALRVVLVRLSGQRLTADHPQVAPILAMADRYVQQYAYVKRAVPAPAGETINPDDPAPAQTTLYLRGLFSPSTVDTVMRQYGLPQWSPRRALVYTVIAVDAPDGGYLLDSSYAQRYPELSDTASLRGLPLLLPPANSLDFAQFWSGNREQAYAEAAAREAEFILFGQLTETGGKWVLQASLEHAEEPLQEWRLRSREPGPLLREVGHRVADIMRGQQAQNPLIPGDGSIVGLWIHGVGGEEDYRKMQSHLQRIPGIDQITLVGQIDGALVFRVSTDASPDTVDRSIRQAGRLIAADRPPGAAESPVWTGELAFHYRLSP